MSGSLFDRGGVRKYLTAKERDAFFQTALGERRSIALFCITLAVTGARISEVLFLTGNRVDTENGAVTFRTLKQRGKVCFRAIPVPRWLLIALCETSSDGSERIWPWGRTTAWKHVKRVLKNAGISWALCKPKALRHAFGVEAGQNGVPLNVVQRWLGHARIETTVIYSEAMGSEERALAEKTWGKMNSTPHLPPDI